MTEQQATEIIEILGIIMQLIAVIVGIMSSRIIIELYEMFTRKRT